MTNAFRYLKHLPSEVNYINSLFVSTFNLLNGLRVEDSCFLSKYKIETNDAVSTLAQILGKSGTVNLEQLVQLFEFVISPSDRIINGAIYTPKNIRTTIMNICLEDYSIEDLKTIRICDIACGCGGFLMDAALYIHKKTDKKFADIYRENIFGIDIQNYSVERTKILLSLLALTHGENADFEFNIIEADTLDFSRSDWDSKYTSFDLIVGNPPYVCSRKVSTETKEKMLAYEVCKSGHPDLYIPFFQIADGMLNENGRLGYITVNSFMRSVNGRSLRKYFSDRKRLLKIVDFRGHQIFNKRSTYTCLFFMKKGIQSDSIEYMANAEANLTDSFVFSKILYSNLDDRKGWNLNENTVIDKMETIGIPIGKYCQSRHGIATLRNHIYIFKPTEEDEQFYYFEKKGIIYSVEKAICKDIVNSNKLNSDIIFESIIEKVIYPYYQNDKGKVYIIEPKKLKRQYPRAYKYLKQHKEELAKRDKAQTEKYPTWYAYGRTQSLTMPQYKLFFPKLANKPLNCVLTDNKDLLLYNGMAFVGEQEERLQILKRILESNIFWKYLIKNAKPYSSDYFSLSGVNIKNFGIPQFNETEINELLSINSKEGIEQWLSKYYI